MDKQLAQTMNGPLSALAALGGTLAIASTIAMTGVELPVINVHNALPIGLTSVAVMALASLPFIKSA